MHISHISTDVHAHVLSGVVVRFTEYWPSADKKQRPQMNADQQHGSFLVPSRSVSEFRVHDFRSKAHPEKSVVATELDWCAVTQEPDGRG